MGFDSAAELLITAGDNPDRVRSEAAFAKLCGACPIPAGSGKTDGRHRLNRGGNRQANASLHRIVISRMRWHPPTIAYVERRTTDGLTKKDIIRCLKRFVAREIYHHLPRTMQTPCLSDCRLYQRKNGWTWPPPRVQPLAAHTESPNQSWIDKLTIQLN